MTKNNTATKNQITKEQEFKKNSAAFSFSGNWGTTEGLDGTTSQFYKLSHTVCPGAWQCLSTASLNNTNTSLSESSNHRAFIPSITEVACALQRG